MAYENIEKLGAIKADSATVSLKETLIQSERKLSDLLKKLAEVEAAALQRRAEEAARRKSGLPRRKPAARPAKRRKPPR